MTARLCLLVLAVLLAADAQRIRLRFVVDPNQGSASSPIAANRVSPYWSTAGATITHRTSQCGSTISAYSGTGSTINTAISDCASGGGGVVVLGAGTFTISDGITFANKPNVTLRGQGPDSTKLVFTGTITCEGAGASICIISVPMNYNDNLHNNVNWTAGYSVGTTQITLTTVPNLAVGSPMILDQLNDDPEADNGGLWMCGAGDAAKGNCCNNESGSCGRGPARTDRGQTFYTRVSAISGSGPYTVTIADPLIHPNWRSGQDPEAWWAGSGASVQMLTGVGVEDLSVDFTSNSGTCGFFFGDATNSWIRNVRSLMLGGSQRAQLRINQSSHITVRDSYFHGKQGSSGNYGWETFGASSTLIENNIGIANSTTVTDVLAGGVIAYNYIEDVAYVGVNWMQPGNNFHSEGNFMVLLEGNDSAGLQLDQIHGVAMFMTGYRNRWHGWDDGKSQQTVPVHNYAYSRFSNMVGNVLGTENYHTVYERYAGGSSTDCALSIFALGWGGNCVTAGGVNPPDDTLVKDTMTRWGNCDLVTDTCRFESSEVPSGLSDYPNSIPASQAIPASLRYTEQPSWWHSGVPWPPIGPDVTGGDLPGSNGKANKIPARVCYEGLSIDTNYAVSKAVSAGSWSAGTKRVTLTIAAHSFAAGDSMHITGITPSAYNGTYLIYSVTGTTVQYGLLTDPGSYTSGGTVYSPGVMVYPGCD